MKKGDPLLSALGEWAGFEVTSVERRAGDPEEIWITLQARKKGLRCGQCGRVARQVHERCERTVRDLPLFDARTYLRVQHYRVWCTHCNGPKRMQITWLSGNQRVTDRLAKSIVLLCEQLPIRHVAQLYGVDWHTVKRVDKRALRGRVGSLDLSDVRVIGMDEFSLRKGHRYATVVVDPIRTRVLWVGRGRGRADIRPFFKQLGSRGCKKIQAVVMDMNGAYEREVQANCPQARIVYDLFHVVAKYARTVITPVRAAQARQLAADQPSRRVLRSSRWLLLRNRDTMETAERLRLDALLDANQALMTVYVLKEDLKQLWRYRHAGYARRFWNHWYQRAMESGLKPLRAFARRLIPYIDGILAHCTWPLHTSLLEGINNRIKVIKRMAYGFRDYEYFFLKICAAFPGKTR